MRNLHYGYLLLLLLPFVSCDLIDDLDDVEFTLEASETVFLLSEEDEAGTFDLQEQNVVLDLESEVEAAGASVDRLEDARPESVTFRVVSAAAPIDFSVIEEVSVTINANGLPPLEFATGDLNGATGSSILLNTADVDLLPYLTADGISYRLLITTNAPIPEDVELGIQPDFRVTASVL